jgi:hypothetical protein
MPAFPIIPVLAALGAVGGAVDENVQNKATIKNAASAEATAQANVTKNVATGQSNLGNYLAANPGPAQAGNQPKASPYAGASIPLAGAPGRAPQSLPGAGAAPGPGMQTAPGGAGTQLPPTVLAALKQAMSNAA